MSARQVISLGCRLNHAESERIAALVDGERDLVVVNSCSVTREAVRHTRQAIRRARKANPDARLLVTGCAAETEREALSAMEEVDGLVGNGAKLDARSWNLPEPQVPLRQAGTRAFIGVQNGCDHSCTFCSIPKGRGASRSDPVSTVLQAVEARLAEDVKEIVLTGVDLTSWGHDLPGEPRLGTLVGAILDRFPQLPRLRLSSVDGIEIDDRLFELIASEQRLMPHLHLSLQHGSDLMLKRMKRRHSRSQALSLVAQLKQRRPDLAIGADLIAGFPTEDASHHADNLSIIAECQIVHGHIFPYSPREGTPAARMPQLDRQTIKARAAELRSAVRRTRDAWLESLIGHEYEVLAEKDGSGYTPHFARVALPEGTAPGAIVTIRPTRIIEGMLA
ncbi:MiaB/RimO family radical SAM methylthiotransferase [Alteriqipengyuania lutimaris]|uniref:MiaB/RimO family radical SAM methylthiotransferase n=1 Tax=Alteriqipengyuania lutimaris TaxID=1538146 RepID=A0A395LPD2_9SPHN|nr:MiaB/RimO family radical SAM methylthiotransferase [Alteriqipengyuania lutimaris]MBB3032590.1 threonylcarbamoyladenosine tRNA methylthiotransferase MtaB [Alteriqipengyuania lutimaris]RDS78287.1 MiaB/RimO family radical SAM methylthiotransferase [Alteriqipengyuania lutimaris]